MVETAELMHTQANLLEDRTMVVVVSQSGRSAETLQLLELLQERAKRPFVVGVTNTADAWLAPLFGDTAQPARTFTNELSQSVWLPNRAVAQAWSEYVKTGATSDTPEQPLPQMRFTDTSARPGAKHRYRIRAVNSAGLESTPSAAAAIP